MNSFLRKGNDYWTTRRDHHPLPTFIFISKLEVMVAGRPESISFLLPHSFSFFFLKRKPSCGREKRKIIVGARMTLLWRFFSYAWIPLLIQAWRKRLQQSFIRFKVVNQSSDDFPCLEVGSSLEKANDSPQLPSTHHQLWTTLKPMKISLEGHRIIILFDFIFIIGYLQM